MDRSKRAVIIGAGIGGLTAAAYLAHAGWQVQVFDSQPNPGGKAQSLSARGYRFDTGPSVFTMREVFDTVFRELSAVARDDIAPIKLDPAFAYWWPDGTHMLLPPGRSAFIRAVQRSLGVPAQEATAYLDSCERIYKTTNRLFLWRSLHDPRTFFSRDFWGSLLGIGRIRALVSMHRANAGFFADTRMQQFADRYATYNGSSPYLTPATLNIISHVENVQGAMTLEGGTYTLVQALERAAVKKGATIHYNSKIDEILLHKPHRFARARAAKIRIGQQHIAADAVISNADVEETYRYLLNDPSAPELKRYLKQEPSSSVIVWYFGVRGSFPELQVNNIFFSSDYQHEFKQIFQEKQVPDDPTMYVNITSKACPADAPEDGENWFVLVNTPPDSGQDWSRLATQVRSRVIARLSQELGVEIEPLIEYEQSLTPADIYTRTGSRQGSIYGISSNSRTAAFSRHPNRSSRIRCLYFCGGSVHPGGGMPMVTLSGRIAARFAMRDAGCNTA